MATKVRICVDGAARLRDAVDTSAGAADEGKFGLLGADGKYHASMVPAAEAVPMSFEAVIGASIDYAGVAVNIYNDSGVLKVRPALSGSGFAGTASGVVLGTGAVGATIVVYPLGSQRTFPMMSNPAAPYAAGDFLYVGQDYGRIEKNAPTLSGHIRQRIGQAISETEVILFQSEPEIIE